MNTLRLAKHRFTLRFNADTMLPPFIGNTIRGALGAALDRQGSRAYVEMFKVDSVRSVPKPYALSVPYTRKTEYKSGDTLEFVATLFGVACDYGTDVVAAAKNMCHGKLANCAFTEYDLVYDRIWSDAGTRGLPPCDAITLNFITPTEILSSKQAIREVGFDMFIDSLIGRIGEIIDTYTDTEFIIPSALILRKPLVSAEYNIKAVRIKTSGQPIEGFVGTIRYSGDITRYLPYIDLGSQIHIGKKTTRSCGEYCFEI